MGERPMSVAGMMYPSRCSELEAMMEKFENSVSEEQEDIITSQQPRAIIVPHSAYSYSGFGAYLAHRTLKNTRPKRIIIMGVNHTYAFKGMSVGVADILLTPCKKLQVDTAYAKELQSRWGALNIPDAHQNAHSTETQFPFIAYLSPMVKVVEVVIGDIELSKLVVFIESLLADEGNAIVLGSDIPPESLIELVDAIHNNDFESVDERLLGLKALVKAVGDFGLFGEVLYEESTPAVGYLSAIFT